MEQKVPTVVIRIRDSIVYAVDSDEPVKVIVHDEDDNPEYTPFHQFLDQREAEVRRKMNLSYIPRGCGGIAIRDAAFWKPSQRAKVKRLVGRAMKRVLSE